MNEITPCPHCQELDDCKHRLVEWYGWPGERIRGSLCEFMMRMEERVSRLVAEACRMGVTPADPGLLAAFELGLEIATNSEFGEDDLRSEIAGEVVQFVSECVQSAPGVTRVTGEPSMSAHPEPRDYVSQFAADLDTVRQHLLDLLAHLEVQLDQFYFERGERPPW